VELLFFRGRYIYFSLSRIIEPARIVIIPELALQFTKELQGQKRHLSSFQPVHISGECIKFMLCLVVVGERKGIRRAQWDELQCEEFKNISTPMTANTAAALLLAACAVFYTH